MEVPTTLTNKDNNDSPGVGNLELVDGNIGTVPRRTQCQAAIRSRASTRQLALEDQQDPDLVEEIRISPEYTPLSLAGIIPWIALRIPFIYRTLLLIFLMKQSTLLSLEEEALPT